MYTATCRHCGRTIAQHPSGTWIPLAGTAETDPTGIYCHRLDDPRHDLLHESMPPGFDGAPQWTTSRTAEDRPADGGADESTDPADPARDNVRDDHVRTSAHGQETRGRSDD